MGRLRDAYDAGVEAGREEALEEFLEEKQDLEEKHASEVGELEDQIQVLEDTNAHLDRSCRKLRKELDWIQAYLKRGEG